MEENTARNRKEHKGRTKRADSVVLTSLFIEAIVISEEGGGGERKGGGKGEERGRSNHKPERDPS